MDIYVYVRLLKQLKKNKTQVFKALFIMMKIKQSNKY